ncbi:4Fe-4S dicluster domain-containing protein [Megalodesulfovibrio paquesii]
MEIKETLREAPIPALVRIPLEPIHKAVVKKKQLVACGEVIAETAAHSAHATGYVHATIDGMVEDITPQAIVIGPAPAPKEGEELPVPARPKARTDLDSLKDDALCRVLLELGIDTGKFRPSRTLVINGLNPEPGVIVSEFLLKEAKPTLERGLELLERAIKPASVFLVLAESKKTPLYSCTVVPSTDKYPYTLDPFAVYKATGAEHPDDVDVISISDLYRVGRVGETGLPLLEAMVSLNGGVWRARTGTPLRELLDAADIPHGKGWQVALDGPMRGEPVCDLAMGVPENCMAVVVVQEGSFPPVGPNPCINCGECVLACPARINPGMLARFVEFDLVEETRSRHIAACLDCGMCAFVCPANRPMLQYLRLAKKQLAAKDAQMAECRLTD